MDFMSNRATFDLCNSSGKDIHELMTWLPDAHSVDQWGGPFFRHPFDTRSFFEDIRWPEMAAYSLKNREQGLLAFGQLYERYQRINLARLIVNPSHRGSGYGHLLVRRLMETARGKWPLEEFSLFVHKNNASAIACYESLGFTPTQCPEETPLGDQVSYMTRRVDLDDLPEASESN